MTCCLTILLSLLWGLSFLGTKTLLVTLAPLEIMAVRWTLAFLTFSLLTIIKVIRIDYRGKPLGPLLLAVLLQPCAYAILETWGIALTTSSESSIFIAMIPLVIVLEEWLIYRKIPSPKILMAMAISFSGVLISVLFSPSFSVGSKILGYLLLIGAVVVGALYNTVFSQKFGSLYTPAEITYAISISGTVFFNMLSLWQGNGIHGYAIVLSDFSSTLAAIFLGVGCSCAAYLIHNYNLSRMKATVVSNIQTNAITVVGVVSGILLGGDDWGWHTLVGLVMAVVGIWISLEENHA